MTDVQNIKTEQTPFIKYGWLRAVLYFISAIIASAIFTYIGVRVLALIFELDLSTIKSNPRDFIKDIGLPASIIVSFFGLLGMLGMTWIYRRFIDRKSFRSLGFDFSDYKNNFISLKP